MYEQEDGEVSNESDELSDDEERDGDVVECMATSLFDALAAAQEASERYQHLDSGIKAILLNLYKTFVRFTN